MGWLGFLIGLPVGAFLGLFAAAAFKAGREFDDCAEGKNRG